MIIYKITNLINKKIYVGQTHLNSEQFFNSNYYGSGQIIKKSIKKYGIRNFKKVVLEKCKTQNELNEKEKKWIKMFNSLVPNGYNIAEGGNGGNLGKDIIKKRQLNVIKNGTYAGKNNPMFGKKHSEETRRKISIATKGKKVVFTLEHRKKLRDARLGKHLSNITKLKLSKSLSGRKLTPFTEEHKLKISKSHKGKIFTDSHKKNISLSKKGKPGKNLGKTYQKIQCLFCNTWGTKNNINRWHNINCKERQFDE